MTDAQRITALESDLATTMQLLKRLIASTEETRKSTQAAVDDLQHSIQLIFENVHVPKVIYKPGKRQIIK